MSGSQYRCVMSGTDLPYAPTRLKSGATTTQYTRFAIRLRVRYAVPGGDIPYLPTSMLSTDMAYLPTSALCGMPRTEVAYGVLSLGTNYQRRLVLTLRTMLLPGVNV